MWPSVAERTVELAEGSLSSVSEAEVLAGENRALLGGECIGFATATLVGTRTYTLSTLLRGLKNTEEFITRHVGGERFIELTGPGISFRDMPTSAVGVERLYKGVADGGQEALAPFYSHTFVGGTIKPFAPCHAKGARDGSNTR